ncbi:MurR/RpiR family transcriptional regulator [Cereibacter azotoformans]|uniref:MurR/RpiR family transcriptional regulator n=1 Tax=Cereibacter azotoformans TaxID=43057 RepID=UPI0015E70310|nr:MurR/RpiR family transcriptional regulator [Cereibacter azotoformans]MBO4168600.1 MurR/RpiR family transcriptional regulator [Cereibacter azotoformans]UIJ31968.1 MurR/RpiR family transcriptional regulator [Cereibacter azotoformans]
MPAMRAEARRRRRLSTIEELMRSALPDLTRAERQLATHILRQYPVAALGSITALAKAADVSTPTVVRLVQKLGFKGYPDFQAGLRGEVEAMLMSPLAKHERWAGGVPDTHILNRFADAVVANLEATLGQIDHAEFDAAARLLADPGRRVFVLGGRITHALADYFVTMMKVTRPEVMLMSDMSSTWPPALLDMGKGDILLLFDIRRYENTVLQVAEMAVEQGVEVVLMTDRWISPAAVHARHTFSCQIEVPSAWDSTVAMLVLLETLISAVQSLTWEQTEARMKRLEELYARSRVFRRHR